MKKTVSTFTAIILIALLVIPISAVAPNDSGNMTSDKTVDGNWGVYRSKDRYTYGKAKPNGCFTIGISMAAEPWKYRSGCYMMTGLPHGTELYISSNKVGSRNHSYFGYLGQ